uniref:Uncharacterized protein n=1 Tax=Dunaliella tertiolecta TaxID=3047 RepID=A0A7S3QTC7_DUNTE
MAASILVTTTYNPGYFHSRHHHCNKAMAGIEGGPGLPSFLSTTGSHPPLHYNETMTGVEGGTGLPSFPSTTGSQPYCFPQLYSSSSFSWNVPSSTSWRYLR